MAATSTFSRSGRAVLVLVLLALLFVAVNVLAQEFFGQTRIDLTEERLYTLDPSTERVLAAIEEPITLRFFFSEQQAQAFPSIRAYGQRVRAMLEEYARRAPGKIRLEVLDPEPFSEAEDQALAYGLQGARTPDGQSVYFGLVAENAIGERARIPFFLAERERFLEYDLTRLIHQLSTPERPILGLISGLPLETGPGGQMAMLQGQPYMIYQQLRESFEVQRLPPDLTRIPDTVDLLVIAHPSTRLPQQTLYAVDQFVLGGGRALVFVDPYSQTSASAAPGLGEAAVETSGIELRSDLAPLLAAWGVAYDPQTVVLDRLLALRISTMIEGRPQVWDYPVWLGLGKSQMNQNDPVTADLSLLNLAVVGHLAPAENATSTLTPLLTSSDQAMLLPAGEIKPTPDPTGLLRRVEPTGERYILAARVEGPVRSAFPGGPPAPAAPEAAGAEAPAPPVAPPADAAPHLAQSEQGIHVIVVADSDLLADEWWVEVAEVFGERMAVPTADNGAFVFNAVENLSGAEGLIGLRGRTVANYPFLAVEEIRRRAEQRYLAEEQRLRAQLEAVQSRLAALEQEAPAEGALVSPEQETEIRRFREEMLATRDALRAVQRNLRDDVERLYAWLRFLNIGLMPLVVAIVALLIALVRHQRRRRRVSAMG